jgi:hypothetical protein
VDRLGFSIYNFISFAVKGTYAVLAELNSMTFRLMAGDATLLRFALDFTAWFFHRPTPPARQRELLKVQWVNPSTPRKREILDGSEKAPIRLIRSEADSDC